MLFEKTNKIDKCLIRMFKEKEGKNNQIMNENENINTNSIVEDILLAVATWIGLEHSSFEKN